MTTTLTRSWNTEFEQQTLNKLFAQYTPHIPPIREYDVTPPNTKEEKSNFYNYWAVTAGHYLFIVQAASKAILLIRDPDLYLLLSRQIGDDGTHTLAFRERVIAVTGRDPIDDVCKEAEYHWEFMGDVPDRNWLGFIAVELHYKHHILPTVVVNSRTSKINDDELVEKSASVFQPDEARHRQAIANWWRKQYEKASPDEKAELAAQLLELDEEVQQRRNHYIKKRWLDARRATGAKTLGIEPVYDAWRQEVISYFLDIPNPKLSSVS